MDQLKQDSANSGRSAFWPVLIIGLAGAGWGAFQAYHLGQEHEGLKKLHGDQDSLVQNAVKLRAQLDGIAADTQRLANGGNANAQVIVTELRRRGVSINVDATPADAEAKK